MTYRVSMHDFPKPLAALTLIAALIFAPPAYLMADEAGVDSASGHLLEAEAALRADDYLRATTEYRKAAQLSDSVEIARQATRMAFDFGFNDEAILAATRWRDLDPDSDEALILLAQVQLRDGDLRSARRNFTTLIERGDQPSDERLFTLMSFISQEDPTLADELMRSLAKPYKNSALAHYATAAMALQADEVDYAIEHSLIAVDLDPDWLKAKLLYARALLLSGEGEKATEYTARMIGDDPDPDPDARMELALMYMTAGRDDDALSQVNQVLLERPSRSDALRMMAIINFQQNNLDAAWDDFEDLLASGDYTADALFYLARIADYREETDRAIRLYSQVMGGKNAVASQRRASALIAFEKDDPERALEHLQAFGDERPRYAVDMVVAQAQILNSLGRYDEALENYGKAVKYRPDDEAIALGRAELMLRMGLLEDSISAYRKAARRWPESSASLNALGYTLADRTSEYREAEKLIRKALKYDPKSPAIIDSLGWVLHKRGKNDAALGHLETAYELFPDHEVAAHLVEVLAALGRKDEALELLTAAELKDPGSDLLKDVRERLFPAAP
jgi:tetratricopeptide (TPR) repeat protein